MRWYYGGNVVAAVFVMAALSFGLGFYGMTVYVATLQHLHGWSAPVTVYYFAGALVTMTIGDVYARLGPRLVVALGGLALAAGVVGLGSVTRAWQLYPVCLVMSLGWGALSGAAINIILAAVVAAGPPGMESGFGQQPRLGSATSDSGRLGPVIRPLRDASGT